jgi:hypothetical protein
VDVKGRRFPGISAGKARYTWECWADREDVSGLQCWEQRFGQGYRGLLVFTYQLGPEVELPEGVEDLCEFRGRRYLLRAVAIDEYRQHVRVRSPKWDTVDLPTAVFQSLVRPFRDFTDPPAEQIAANGEAHEWLE